MSVILFEPLCLPSESLFDFTADGVPCVVRKTLPVFHHGIVCIFIFLVIITETAVPLKSVLGGVVVAAQQNFYVVI